MVIRSLRIMEIGEVIDSGRITKTDGVTRNSEGTPCVVIREATIDEWNAERVNMGANPTKPLLPSHYYKISTD